MTGRAVTSHRTGSPETREFRRSLGLFDSTMVVVGAMIGSGIFLVSADMTRLLGSASWVLVAWGITAVLTLAAALSYGELAAMMPRAGGQYVYLREAFSPIAGFLYGWTLFAVIQPAPPGCPWRPRCRGRIAWLRQHPKVEIMMPR